MPDRETRFRLVRLRVKMTHRRGNPKLSEEDEMATTDTCCSIHPYFEIHAGSEADFRAVADRCVAATSERAKEEGCLFYGFSYEGRTAHCREAYRDAEGLLTHVGNIQELLGEALQLSNLLRVEVHGPAHELALLRQPLAALEPTFFVLESGFRA